MRLRKVSTVILLRSCVTFCQISLSINLSINVKTDLNPLEFRNETFFLLLLFGFVFSPKDADHVRETGHHPPLSWRMDQTVGQVLLHSHPLYVQLRLLRLGIVPRILSRAMLRESLPDRQVMVLFLRSE